MKLRAILQQALRSASSIEQLVTVAENAGAWNRINSDRIVIAWKKMVIRQAVNHLRDAGGLPVAFSLEGHGDGRIYCPRELMTSEDYGDVVGDEIQRAEYHLLVAVKLAAEAEVRFGEVIDVPMLVEASI